jgi:hypothetical protein
MANIFRAKSLISRTGFFSNEVFSPNLIYNTGDQSISGVKTFANSGLFLDGIKVGNNSIYITENRIEGGYSSGSNSTDGLLGIQYNGYFDNDPTWFNTGSVRPIITQLGLNGASPGVLDGTYTQAAEGLSYFTGDNGFNIYAYRASPPYESYWFVSDTNNFNTSYYISYDLETWETGIYGEIAPTATILQTKNYENGIDFGINRGLINGTSSQWIGYFKAPESTDYNFTLNADEVAYFWTGDKALNGYTTGNADISVSAGGGSSQISTLNSGEHYPVRLQWGHPLAPTSANLSLSVAYNATNFYNFSGLFFHGTAGKGFYIDAISGDASFAGNIQSNTATFNNRPTVNGTGVLLSGEAASLPATIVYTTGNQTISGNKNFVENITVGDQNQDNLFVVSGNEISFGVIPTISGNPLLTGIDLSSYATVANLETTGSTLSSSINSLSGFFTEYTGNLDATFASDIQLTNTGITLVDSISSLSGLFTGYTGNLDSTFASDIQLFNTGSNLSISIHSLSGTLTGHYVTKSNGLFTNTPTVNGTNVLLSGEVITSGDLTGYLPYPTVNKLQGYKLDLGAAPADGQTLQWNAGTSSWKAGSIPAGGNGGGGLVYYFNFLNQSGILPTGGLPTSGFTSLSLLGRNYSIVSGSYTTPDLAPQNSYILINHFVTASGTPGVTNIPAGLWDFNIWANTDSASATQTAMKAVVNIYNPLTSSYRFLGQSDDVYLYDQQTIAQYLLNATVPQTGIQSYERIYIQLFGKKTTNPARTISIYFDSYRPTHVHTTIPSVAGDGVVKVINGVFQTPATGIFDADVDNNANIAQSKIANLTTDLNSLRISGETLNTKINSLSGTYQNFVDNLDLTYATDLQLANTGTTLVNSINSLSGTSVLTFGNQLINGTKTFNSGVVINVQPTGTNPALYITGTWSNPNQIYTGISLSISGDSDPNSLLMDLKSGTSTRFSVKKDGTITFGYGSIAPAVGWVGNLRISAGGINIGNLGNTIQFPGGGLLRGDTNHIIEQFNGTNPQQFRVYNVTGTNSGEFGLVGWVTGLSSGLTTGTSTGMGPSLVIGSQNTSSGILRDVIITGSNIHLIPAGGGTINFYTGNGIIGSQIRSDGGLYFSPKSTVAGSTSSIYTDIQDILYIDANLGGGKFIRIGRSPYYLDVQNSNLYYQTNSNNYFRLAPDTINNLSLRNGTNPNTFRVYNATGTNSGEFGLFGWDGNNNLIIGSQATSSGILRNISITGSNININSNSNINLNPSIANNGYVTLNGNSAYLMVINGGVNQSALGKHPLGTYDGLHLTQGRYLTWSSSQINSTSPYLFLVDDGANILAQRNPISPLSGQQFRIYNATGTNSGEFGLFGWQNNQLVVGSQATNSGVFRDTIITGNNIYLGTTGSNFVYIKNTLNLNDSNSKIVFNTQQNNATNTISVNGNGSLTFTEGPANNGSNATSYIFNGKNWTDGTTLDVQRTSTSLFTVRSLGNVGIGITNPSGKLSVSGDIRNYYGNSTNINSGEYGLMGWVTGVGINPYLVIGAQQINSGILRDLTLTGNNININGSGAFNVFDNTNIVGNLNVTGNILLSGNQVLTGSSTLYATSANLATTGLTLDTKINNLSGVSVLTFGNQTINGIKTFANGSNQILNTTYSNLTGLKAISGLLSGQLYRISDFVLKWNNQSINDQTVKTAASGEPLIVTALSNKEIYHLAQSEIYPQDTIYYNIDAIGSYSWGEINNNQPIPDFKGWIYRRVDNLLDIDIPYDWRNITVNCCKPDVSSVPYYSGNHSYTKLDYVIETGNNSNRGKLYYSVATGNSGNALDNTNFWNSVSSFVESGTFFSTDENNTFVALYDVNLGGFRINLPFLTTSRIQQPTFTSTLTGLGAFTLSNVKNIKIEGGYSNVIIGNNFYYNAIGNSFNNNTIDDGFYNNTIGNSFNNNTVGNSFYYNTIGNSFNNNTVGNSFNYNTIGNYFTYNTVGNSSNSNTIGNTFYNNAVGNSFYYNTVGNDFNTNTIGNSFNNNTVGNSFYYNTIGNSSNSNTIGNYFYSNTIGDNFIHNTSENGFNSIDFTSSTHVYNSYNTTLFQNSANSMRLRYFNSSDQLVVTDPTA